MTRITVDSLSFDFPDTWEVDKYDDWIFYQNQFRKMWNNIKAVDLIAIDDQRTVWFIEVKDFRRHQRQNPSPLPQSIADKVFATLAAMLPAKLNATTHSEQQLASKVLKATKIRVVFHLEQPTTSSKLFPRTFNPADVKLKLRQLLKPIDAHVLVIEQNNMSHVGWCLSN